MKVLMVVGQFYPIAGGTEKECQKLAAQLLKRGMAVTVLTQYSSGSPDYEVVGGIPVYRRMKGWHFYEYTYMLSVLWFLLWRVREYDIIQCFGLYLFIPPVVLVKYFFRKKAVGRIEGSGLYGDFYRIRQLSCSRLILASAHKLDKIISISGQIKREILAEGFFEESVVTIPNSVDHDIYKPGSHSDRRLGKSICFVGRLAEEKGLSYLINAMHTVADELKGVKLFIVGDGQLKGSLENLSERLGLQGQVVFIGNALSLPHYQESDFFVLPSLSEGLPLSLLEAMACGLPVIATDVGGNREVLDPSGAGEGIPVSHYHIGEYGILVNPVDVEGLASAILRMLKDDELAHHWKSKAREHVIKNYGLDKVINDYLTLYEFAQ